MWSQIFLARVGTLRLKWPKILLLHPPKSQLFLVTSRPNIQAWSLLSGCKAKTDEALNHYTTRELPLEAGNRGFEVVCTRNADKKTLQTPYFGEVRIVASMNRCGRVFTVYWGTLMLWYKLTMLWYKLTTLSHNFVNGRVPAGGSSGSSRQSRKAGQTPFRTLTSVNYRV